MAESAHSSGESLFLVPFNLFYYLGFVPFRTQHNPETNRYELRTCLVQKIVCVFSHIFLLINQIYYLVSGCLQFRRNSETSIVHLFHTVSNLTFTCSILLLIFHIWRQRQGYLEFLEHTRCELKRRSCQKLSVYIGLLAFSLFSMGICWFLINDSGHFASQMTMYSDDSTSTTWETENVTMPESESDNGHPIRIDRFIHFGMVMMFMHSGCFFGFVNGLIFVLTFALIKLGTEFRNELQNSKEEYDLNKGVRLYGKLKETTELARKMYGDYVLILCMSTVTYCVQAPHVWMGKRGDTEKVILFVFACTNIVWIFAAELHDKVHNSVLEWLTFFTNSESLSLEDQLKLLSTRLEVSTDPVALSCRCFSVTYKHLSSMVGVVATYGVIVIQLNQEKDSSKTL